MSTGCVSGSVEFDDQLTIVKNIFEFIKHIPFGEIFIFIFIFFWLIVPFILYSIKSKLDILIDVTVQTNQELQELNERLKD